MQRPARMYDCSLIIPILGLRGPVKRWRMLAKSYGQKWIRITILFIYDLRTNFRQSIDSKQPRISYFAAI
jgi:hypothetical protein